MVDRSELDDEERFTWDGVLTSFGPMKMAESGRVREVDICPDLSAVDRLLGDG